jgi:hypothetical protein
VVELLPSMSKALGLIPHHKKKEKKKKGKEEEKE